MVEGPYGEELKGKKLLVGANGDENGMERKRMMCGEKKVEKSRRF